jgi:Tol biopolymer transport system component/tRNA A-37 threonylcarbamoyl transferase component Bud32
MNRTDVQDRLQLALGAAYVIERELGGGGMSRVFVAHEAALGRKVVVKVLRPELAEGLSADRFKREVRLAARLQHPHIVPLLAAGEIDGGVLFYTMPLVEGESLRARLAREGALPIAGAVRILCDVAGALAYAHRTGVVHRDVKPENILLSDGGAVVADFGIAKAITASREGGGDGDARRSSTLTAVGTSLGTPAYMAPEQATGDVVDHRADLYALGLVGYEMLAGWAPFEGRTAQQLLAAHATETPEPIARRRASVPPRLAALITRLLEKNPADRPQSADDVRRALDELPSGEMGPETPERTVATASVARPARQLAPWALLGALIVLAGAATGAMLARSRRAEAPRRVLVAALPAPAGQELRPEGGLSLSPDGSQLAFVAADRSGATAVWIRALDSLAAARVDGTDGGSGPFWSPDGGSLGYFAGGQLRVVELHSGTHRALCPASRPGGGAWTTGGVIAYSPDFLSVPLFKVEADGGPCTPLTRFRPGESVHRRPSALPDGRHVLFSSGRTGATTVVAVDLTTGAITDVRPSGGDPLFAKPDWMFFREGTMGPTGPLLAQRLDLKAFRPIGEPRVLLEHVIGVRTLPSYAASPNALVALQMNSGAQSLVWVNRQSVVVDSVRAPTGPIAYFGASSAALARGGRRIGFAAAGQLWLYDRDRKVATRAHTGIIPGQGILEPAWGPGDSLVAYRTLFSGPLILGLYHVDTDTADSLFSSGMRNIRTPDWSPDGQRIAFQLSAGDSATKDEIWIYSRAERRATRAWDAQGNLASPRWSPDGRWLAYVSDETGAPEVYIRGVSGSGVAVRVSGAGGEFPVWRPDGRGLYYRVPDGAIMGVGVKLGPTISLSPPSVALAAPPFSRMVRSFEVTPDGQRFVGFGREDPLLFTLVLDWAGRLPAR